MIRRATCLALALAANLLAGPSAGLIASTALAAPKTLTNAPPLGEVDERDAWLEATVARADSRYFELELIILSVRGYYAVSVTREQLELPELPGFSWMELGRDEWRDIWVDGRQLRGFERRIALFAERPGVLTIPPFVHHLEITSPGGARSSVDVLSKPIDLAIEAVPLAEGWWLPAQAVTIEERWSRRPDQLSFGEATERTVTLTAVGAAPEMLPPAPSLSASGAHVFPHPERRERQLTADGPVSSVTWRWTVTLLRPEAVVMDDVTIPWFDVDERAFRAASLPRYRIALAEAVDTALEETWVRWAALRSTWIGAAVGATLGLGLALYRRRFEDLRGLRRSIDALSTRTRIGWAIWRRDAKGLRAIAHRLQHAASVAEKRGAIASAVADLDRQLYSRDAPATIASSTLRSAGRRLAATL